MVPISIHFVPLIWDWVTGVCAKTLRLPSPATSSRTCGGDAEVFLRQPRDIISPAGPQSAQRPLTKMSRRHPNRMPVLPFLAPLDTEEQQIHSETLLDDKALHPEPLGETLHPLEEAHFGHTHLQSHCYCQPAAHGHWRGLERRSACKWIASPFGSALSSPCRTGTVFRCCSSMIIHPVSTKNRDVSLSGC